MRWIFIFSFILIFIGFSKADEPIDPWEKGNRKIFHFNYQIDKHLIIPATRSYRNLLGETIYSKLSNVFKNLNEPKNFVNNLLQAKPILASKNLLRFGINSTIGILGISDVAKKMGLNPKTEDFGQTLGYYGYENSKYIIFPISGPSTLRDTIGKIPDLFLNPLSYTPQGFGLNIWRIFHIRSEYLEIDEEFREEKEKYEIIRTLYLGGRDYAIGD